MYFQQIESNKFTAVSTGGARSAWALVDGATGIDYLSVTSTGVGTWKPTGATARDYYSISCAPDGTVWAASRRQQSNVHLVHEYYPGNPYMAPGSTSQAGAWRTAMLWFSDSNTGNISAGSAQFKGFWDPLPRTKKLHPAYYLGDGWINHLDHCLPAKYSYTAIANNGQGDMLIAGTAGDEHVLLWLRQARYPVVIGTQGPYKSMTMTPGMPFMALNGHNQLVKYVGEGHWAAVPLTAVSFDRKTGSWAKKPFPKYTLDTFSIAPDGTAYLCCFEEESPFSTFTFASVAIGDDAETSFEDQPGTTLLASGAQPSAANHALPATEMQLEQHVPQLPEEV